MLRLQSLQGPATRPAASHVPLHPCVHPHLTSLILMTAEWPILWTATTLSPRWQYLSCFATDMAACMPCSTSVKANGI